MSHWRDRLRDEIADAVDRREGRSPNYSSRSDVGHVGIVLRVRAHKPRTNATRPGTSPSLCRGRSNDEGQWAKPLPPCRA